MSREYQFHPISEFYPLIEGAEFDSLVEDVARNGVIQDIWLHEGKILDGRNRYRAATKCGRDDYKTRDWSGECSDPVSFVVTSNNRRHQTPSQRAMCAARAREWFDQQAKKRQTATLKHGDKSPVMEEVPQREGTARDLAGRAFKVSGKLVDKARTVVERGVPELVQLVDSGKCSVEKAAVIATVSPEKQHELISKGKEEIDKEAHRIRVRNHREKKKSSCGVTDRNMASACAAAKKFYAMTRLPFSQLSIVELRECADGLMAALVKATGVEMENW